MPGHIPWPQNNTETVGLVSLETLLVPWLGRAFIVLQDGHSCTCHPLGGLHVAQQYQPGSVHQNNITDYRVELPNRVVLIGNHYEMALDSFTYLPMWYNMPSIASQLRMTIFSQDTSIA